jgi:hypothetical protein
LTIRWGHAWTTGGSWEFIPDDQLPSDRARQIAFTKSSEAATTPEHSCDSEYAQHAGHRARSKSGVTAGLIVLAGRQVAAACRTSTLDCSRSRARHSAAPRRRLRRAARTVNPRLNEPPGC